MQTKIYILFIFLQNKKPLFRYALYQNNGLYLVEMRGFEPLTSYMRSKRSSQLSYTPKLLLF